MKKLPLFILFLCAYSFISLAQSNLFDLNSLQKIEIYFSQSNWDYQMDTAKIGSDGYIKAQYVKVNGVKIDSVGVKYKGNSSYDSTYTKNPLHIKLTAFKKGQSYNGITEIKLSNAYADPSMLREVMAYKILSDYMDCSRSNFAQIYINGKYMGLYTNDEDISKDFLSSHFYSSGNTLIKCNPIGKVSVTTKSNLKYISTDSSQYSKFYDLKSKTGWNELVRLCDSVTNKPTSIQSVMDVDRALWMLAFNNVIINLDSYSGVFCQNYYLYKDDTQRFNPIMWDMNMAFGSFAFVGSGNSSMGQLTIPNMQQLSLTIHSNDNYWPLIKNLFANPMYKRMFIAHAKTIFSEHFDNSSYKTLATQLQTLTDTAVKSDTNKFFTYDQFKNGMTTDVVFGSNTIPGISNLMDPRVTYLKSTPEFTAVAPTISNITPSSTSPVIGSDLTITAKVTDTNTDAVYLGYCFAAQAKFNRIRMYDDGAHNDGSAGDNVYGIILKMEDAKIQYYIYAENNNAGMFSPVRAEHEFYSLNGSTPNIKLGDVVINEYLASNKTDTVNDLGQYEDWFELYNRTSNNIDLSGVYLSNSKTNLKKFLIPKNTQISSKGFLLIWADNGKSVPNFIHANFKLSKDGESLYISTNDGTIIDSLSFGPQITDVTEGRCPDGAKKIEILARPSPGKPNCDNIAVNEFEDNAAFNLFPNPAKGIATIEFNSNHKEHDISIYNYSGEIVYSKKSSGISDKLNLSDLSEGIYLIRVNQSVGRKLVISK